MRMLHVILPSRIPMRRRLVNIILSLTQWPQAVISDARATPSPQPVTAAKIPRHYCELVSPSELFDSAEAASLEAGNVHGH